MQTIKNWTKKQKILAGVILVAVIALAAWGIYALNNPSDAKVEASYQKLAEDNILDTDDPINRHIDFDSLSSDNPDIIGWIYVPNTNIDYPIMQSDGDEDEYYLNTTFEGVSNRLGSIYIEKYNQKDFSDPVTVVYGHTFFDDTDAMFTELHYYEDETFFKENPYIYIYTPDQTIQYRVFCISVFDDRYILGNYAFYQDADFQKYLNELKSSDGALVDTTVDVTKDSTILTLSTCIQGQEENRFLVNATKAQSVAVVN